MQVTDKTFNGKVLSEDVIATILFAYNLRTALYRPEDKFLGSNAFSLLRWSEKDNKKPRTPTSLLDLCFLYAPPETPDICSHQFRYVGLKNLGATCYMNCYLQTLYMNLDFRHKLLNLNRELLVMTIDKTEPDVVTELRKLFCALQSGNSQVVDPSSVARTLRIATDAQQDATEFATLLLMTLERQLGGTQSEHNFIPQLFRGVQTQKMRCGCCGNVSTRKEDFYELRVQLSSHSMVQEETGIVEDIKKQGSARVMCPVEAVSCIESVEASDTPHTPQTSPRCQGSRLDEEEEEEVEDERVSATLRKKMSDKEDLKKTGSSSLPPSSLLNSQKKVFYLETGLANLFRSEKLKDDNLYMCNVCKKKVEAERRVFLESAPPYLHICFERYAYTVGNRKKLTSLVDFPLTLSLKTYRLDKQESCTHSVDTCLTQDASLMPTFEDEYELFSILEHQGCSALTGHYVSYIRDLEKASQEVVDENHQKNSKEKVLNQKKKKKGKHGHKSSSDALDTVVAVPRVPSEPQGRQEFPDVASSTSCNLKTTAGVSTGDDTTKVSKPAGRLCNPRHKKTRKGPLKIKDKDASISQAEDAPSNEHHPEEKSNVDGHGRAAVCDKKIGFQTPELLCIKDTTQEDCSSASLTVTRKLQDHVVKKKRHFDICGEGNAVEGGGRKNLARDKKLPRSASVTPVGGETSVSPLVMDAAGYDPSPAGQPNHRGFSNDLERSTFPLYGKGSIPAGSTPLMFPFTGGFSLSDHSLMPPTRASSNTFQTLPFHNLPPDVPLSSEQLWLLQSYGAYSQVHPFFHPPRPWSPLVCQSFPHMSYVAPELYGLPGSCGYLDSSKNGSDGTYYSTGKMAYPMQRETAESVFHQHTRPLGASFSSPQAFSVPERPLQTVYRPEDSFVEKKRTSTISPQLDSPSISLNSRSTQPKHRYHEPMRCSTPQSPPSWISSMAPKCQAKESPFPKSVSAECRGSNAPFNPAPPSSPAAHLTQVALRWEETLPRLAPSEGDLTTKSRGAASCVEGHRTMYKCGPDLAASISSLVQDVSEFKSAALNTDDKGGAKILDPRGSGLYGGRKDHETSTDKVLSHESPLQHPSPDEPLQLEQPHTEMELLENIPRQHSSALTSCVVSSKTPPNSLNEGVVKKKDSKPCITQHGDEAGLVGSSSVALTKRRVKEESQMSRSSPLTQPLDQRWSWIQFDDATVTEWKIEQHYIKSSSDPDGPQGNPSSLKASSKKRLASRSAYLIIYKAKNWKSTPSQHRETTTSTEKRPDVQSPAALFSKDATSPPLMPQEHGVAEPPHVSSPQDVPSKSVNMSAEQQRRGALFQRLQQSVYVFHKQCRELQKSQYTVQNEWPLLKYCLTSMVFIPIVWWNEFSAAQILQSSATTMPRRPSLTPQHVTPPIFTSESTGTCHQWTGEDPLQQKSSEAFQSLVCFSTPTSSSTSLSSKDRMVMYNDILCPHSLNILPFTLGGHVGKGDELEDESQRRQGVEEVDRQGQEAGSESPGLFSDPYGVDPFAVWDGKAKLLLESMVRELFKEYHLMANIPYIKFSKLICLKCVEGFCNLVECYFEQQRLYHNLRDFVLGHSVVGQDKMVPKKDSDILAVNTEEKTEEKKNKKKRKKKGKDEEGEEDVNLLTWITRRSLFDLDSRFSSRDKTRRGLDGLYTIYHAVDDVRRSLRILREAQSCWTPLRQNASRSEGDQTKHDQKPFMHSSTGFSHPEAGGSEMETGEHFRETIKGIAPINMTRDVLCLHGKLLPESQSSVVRALIPKNKLDSFLALEERRMDILINTFLLSEHLVLHSKVYMENCLDVKHFKKITSKSNNRVLLYVPELDSQLCSLCQQSMEESRQKVQLWRKKVDLEKASLKDYIFRRSCKLMKQPDVKRATYSLENGRHYLVPTSWLGRYISQYLMAKNEESAIFPDVIDGSCLLRRCTHQSDVPITTLAYDPVAYFSYPYCGSLILHPKDNPRFPERDLYVLVHQEEFELLSSMYGSINVPYLTVHVATLEPCHETQPPPKDLMDPSQDSSQLTGHIQHVKNSSGSVHYSYSLPVCDQCVYEHLFSPGGPGDFTDVVLQLSVQTAKASLARQTSRRQLLSVSGDTSVRTVVEKFISTVNLSLHYLSEGLVELFLEGPVIIPFFDKTAVRQLHHSTICSTYEDTPTVQQSMLVDENDNTTCCSSYSYRPPNTLWCSLHLSHSSRQQLRDFHVKIDSRWTLRLADGQRFTDSSIP